MGSIKGKSSRLKKRDKDSIVFERIEEIEIRGIQQAKQSLNKIEEAIADTERNIERVQKHKDLLETEKEEIEKYIKENEK